MPAPQLAAFFWTGAAPAANFVRDISYSGLYLLVKERWYPGTLLMLTLQIDKDDGSELRNSIAVQAKVVRWGEDGVGLEFLLLESNDPRRSHTFHEGGADSKNLKKFLKEYFPENGSAVVHYVIPPEGGRNT